MVLPPLHAAGTALILETHKMMASVCSLLLHRVERRCRNCAHSSASSIQAFIRVGGSSHPATSAPRTSSGGLVREEG